MIKTRNIFIESVWNICSNTGSDSLNSGASVFEGPDSYFSWPTVFGRPFIKAFKVLAYVFYWVQIKDAIRAENTLIKVSWRVVWKVVCQTLTAILVRPRLGDIYVPDVEDSKEPLFELCYSASSRTGHHTWPLWEIENVIIQPSLDCASNFISEVFIPSMIFGTRRIAKLIINRSWIMQKKSGPSIFLEKKQASDDF